MKQLPKIYMSIAVIYFVAAGYVSTFNIEASLIWAAGGCVWIFWGVVMCGVEW